MHTNFVHFRFLSGIPKVKALSVQKGFSMAQHCKRYHKCVETLSFD